MEETIQDRISKIAERIEEKFHVPAEFIQKLLIKELDRIYQTQRHGIIAEISKMLEENCWEAGK